MLYVNILYIYIYFGVEHWLALRVSYSVERAGPGPVRAAVTVGWGWWVWWVMKILLRRRRSAVCLCSGQFGEGVFTLYSTFASFPEPRQSVQ